MKKLPFILLLLFSFGCQSSSKNSEKQASAEYQSGNWRHLAYLIRLKNAVAEKHWSEFSEKDLYQPALFYTHEGTFVLNPNDHIKKISEYQKTAPFDGVERIRLSEQYTDTIHFDFSASYSDSDSTAMHYLDNVLSFQSFDLTKKLIGIEDLQDWSIMVIHELFHGYQMAIPEFKAYYTQLEIPGGPDAFLGNYHKDLEWFRESIHEENEILKSIWIDDVDPATGIQKYLTLRSKRLDRIKEEFGADIREAEDYEILMEGHARYFESLCKRHLSNNTGNTEMLHQDDLVFITHMFEGYQVKKDKGLHDIYNNRYYYPLGYNISMILEKYLPAYRETIYTKEHNFNQYLETLKVQHLDDEP